MIQAKIFATALAAVAAVVERRNTIPVLSNVLLEAGADRLRMTASNGDVWVSRELDAPGIGEWAWTVPAAGLLDTLKKTPAPDTEVALIPPGEEPRMRVLLGRQTMRFPVIDADSFPTVEPTDTVAGIQLDRADLVAMAKAATPFMGKGANGAYFLRGAHLGLEGDAVIMRATNGAKLFRRRLPSPVVTGEAIDAIIPAEAIMVLGKFGDGDGDGWVELTSRMVRITAGDLEIVAKLIDAAYPKLGAPETVNAATVSAAALRQAVELVTVVAGTSERRFTLELTGDDLVLSCRGFDGEAETAIKGTGHGVAFKVFLAGANLVQTLKSFGKDDVVIEYAGDNAPMTFRSTRDDTVEATVKADSIHGPQPMARPVVTFEAPTTTGCQDYYRVRVQRMPNDRDVGWRYYEFPSAAAAHRAYRRHVADARLRCDVTAEPLAVSVWATTGPVPRQNFTADIPASGYMPLPPWYLEDVQRRMNRRFSSELVFSKAEEGVPTWTREVLDRKDAHELLETPGLTMWKGRTKAFRTIGERWFAMGRGVVAPLEAEPAAPAIVIPVADNGWLEPLPEGYVPLTMDQLMDMARRAERKAAAEAVFTSVNDNDVPWTRKILGLKLRDAVEPTPMLTVLKGRTGPIRALGATALKRAA